MPSLHAAIAYRPRLSSPPRPRRHGARGFTLLEVLVAIVVLSFGVLGVVGLQAASLQANKLARYQSTAVQLGSELADMMRGNKDVAKQTSSAANPYLIANFVADTDTPVPPASENCTTGPCSTTTKVAEFQITEWKQTIANSLPGARVVVCFDVAPYSGGLPTFNCTTGPLAMPVIKIGWTRENFSHGTVTSGLDQATLPGVVIPVIPAQ